MAHFRGRLLGNGQIRSKTSEVEVKFGSATRSEISLGLKSEERGAWKLQVAYPSLELS